MTEDIKHTPWWMKFLGAYARFMEFSAKRKRDDIRKAQEETGRKYERITKFRIYSSDMRYRRNPNFRQSCVELVYCLRGDGNIERMPPETPEDVLVVTDVPCVYGIATGAFEYTGADGRKIRREPFGPKEAFLLGRMESNGDVDAMLEVKVLMAKVPDFSDLLRIPKTDGPA